MTTSLVIDTDTASDDAIAMILAARTPGCRIRAVTMVAGNVPLEQACRNALVTLELVGLDDVPVFAGAAGPIDRPLVVTGQDVHGPDGFAEHDVCEPSRKVDAGVAADELCRIGREEPGEHVLVAIGPLTNLAIALDRDPDLLTRFERTVIMGGAFDGVGNITEHAEFNIWVDPAAAHAVCAAPGTKVFVGWDVSRRQSKVSQDRRNEWRQLGRFGEFAVGITEFVDAFVRELGDDNGFEQPDPLAMAIAIDPAVVTLAEVADVAISLDDDTMGRSQFCSAADSTTTVVRMIDESRFWVLMTAALSTD